MKALYKVLTIFSCALILGCTNSYNIAELKNPHEPLPSYNDYTLKRPFGKVMITGASKNVLEEIKRDFNSAPLAAQFSVSRIRISHNLEDKEFKGNEGAHFYTDSLPLQIKFDGYCPRIILPSGKICINISYYNGLIRHEMTHAQVFFWKISLQEIGKISQWKYNYRLWELENYAEYPKDGFLYRYSTKDEDEETANLVAAVSNFFFDLRDPYTKAPHAFSGINRKDLRYLQKIEAIHKLELTTNIEHKKIMEFFSKK